MCRLHTTSIVVYLLYLAKTDHVILHFYYFCHAKTTLPSAANTAKMYTLN